MSYQVFQHKDKWDFCISGTGISTVFCSRNFSKIYCTAPKLFVYRQGHRAAAFVFSQAKNTVSGLHYGGVVTNCQDKSFCQDVSSTLIKYLHAQGMVSCQVRNHPFLSTIKIGELIKEEPFVFIDLTRPGKEIEAGITKQHRRSIRRAQEGGLDAMYSDDVKYLKIFYEYYRTRQEQIGIQPKSYMFFGRMFRLLRDHLMMGVVRKAEKVLAVSLLLKDSGNVFMTYGGMSDEGYECYAKHLMIFDMMLKFKSKCFSRLVLGTGNNGKDPIYNFKRGFTDRESSVCTYGIR